MGSWLPGLTGSRRLWALVAAFGACGVMPAAASGPSAPPGAAGIQAITLERGCFGCADAGVIELRRDGVARLTVTGQARMGTQDKTSQGRLTPGEFDRLAALLVAQGFFKLGDIYEDPQTRDGPWFTLGVVGPLPAKQVFSRDGAGPAALKRMADAVDATRSRIRFTP
jgi:hypothetical protein